MKSIKDIENITLEELEAVSLDEKIAVPHGLSSKIASTTSGERRKIYFLVSTAAAIVIAAGLSLSLLNEEPEDISRIRRARKGTCNSVRRHQEGYRDDDDVRICNRKINRNI